MSYAFVSFSSIILGYYFAFGFKGRILATLSKPYIYVSDAVLVVAWMKMLQAGEWIPFLSPQSQFLGAPFGMTMKDFAGSSGILQVILWLFSFMHPNPVVALNIYFLGTFAMAATAMLWLLLREDVPPAIATLLAVFFSVLPFHFMRYAQIYYLAYFIVPLAIAYLMDFERRVRGGDFRLKAVDFVFAVFIAGSEVYHCYFTLFLLTLISLVASPSSQSVMKVKFLWIRVVGLIFVSLIVFMSPVLFHWLKYGRNLSAAARAAEDSEFYGLKILNLFVPTPDTSIAFLRDFFAPFYARTPWVEGLEESISIVGFGSLIVLILAPFTAFAYGRLRAVRSISLMVTSLLLFCTAGGIGAIIAQVGFTSIRAYNRASIWIAALAILNIGLIAAYLLRNHSQRIVYATMFVCIGFMFFEVAPNKPRSKRYQRYYDVTSDKEFFSKLESKLPSGAMVLNLPFMYFLESAPIHKMQDYEHLRAYILTERLKFSYGLVRGREEAEKVRALSEPKLDIPSIDKYGYAALAIDRRGYVDEGRAILKGLRASARFREVIESGDGLRFAVILKLD